MTDEDDPTEQNDPYRPPADDEVVRAIAVPAAPNTPFPAPGPELPRVWTAFVVSTGSILAAAIFAGILFVIAMFTIGEVPFDETAQDVEITEVIGKVAAHPLGLWIIVLPGQLCFLGAAIAAVYLSPVAIKERLNLVRGEFPPWTWILMAVATPAVSFMIAILLSSTNQEPSEQLKAMEELITSQGGARFLITALLIAVAPGISEELVFRGYLQTRLLQRWSPRVAIIVSAAIFAAAHIDPMHVLAVFPLGLWLGVVAWRTGSIFPAIICHFTNNFFALAMSQFNRDLDPEKLTATDMMIFAPCLLAMVVCLTLFARAKAPRRIDIA